MRGAGFMLLTFLAACGGSGSGDASGDSGVSSDVAPFDGDVACAPISGSSPFGVRVHGEVRFDDPATNPHPITLDAQLLFPKGRVTGAPVILVGLGYDPSYGFATSTATLDDGLGATGLRVAYQSPCPGEIDATLAGPSDGLVARVAADLSAPLDGFTLVNGSAKFCASGPVPAKATLTAPTTLGPTSTMVVTSDFPLDPATAATTRVLAGGSSTSADVEVSSGFLLIKPNPAFPPAAKDLEIDLSSVRDLLGRPLDPLPHVELAVPTGAVVDPAFDTLPPAEAMVGTRTASIDAGALWWKPKPSYSPEIRVDVLGLGAAPATAHVIRLRHRLDSPTGTTVLLRAAIVSARRYGPIAGLRSVADVRRREAAAHRAVALLPRPRNEDRGSDAVQLSFQVRRRHVRHRRVRVRMIDHASIHNTASIAHAVRSFSIIPASSCASSGGVRSGACTSHLRRTAMSLLASWI